MTEARDWREGRGKACILITNGPRDQLPKSSKQAMVSEADYGEGHISLIQFDPQNDLARFC